MGAVNPGYGEMSGGGGNRSDSRRANLRTALIMLSIAAVFFAGIIVKYWLFG